MNYDLSHLTQHDRRVYGPIQDDEALLLYAFIRCTGVKVVLEAGGQTGYSARNFLAAGATVFTVDTQPVRKLHARHHVIQASIGDVPLEEIPRCGLVFFDAHVEDDQWRFYRRAAERAVIDDDTTLVVHDTGLHAQKHVDWAVPCGDKWAHQPSERRLVERLADDGWHCIHVHDDQADEPRHGLTILQRQRVLT